MTIEEKIDAILQRLDTLVSELKTARAAAPVEVKPAKLEADDYDLDGPHGDPVVRYPLKPKYYTGPPFDGKRLSELSIPELTAWARYQDACAFMKRKEGDERIAGFKEKDAALARGWIRRKRDPAFVPPAPRPKAAATQAFDPETGEVPMSEDQLPF